MIGKARMEWKAVLTFACMNLKKLAKMKQRYGLLRPLKEHFGAAFSLLVEIFLQNKKPGSEIAF